MPFTNENVIFGSEFDPSGIVKYATAAIDNLKKVGTAQEGVNATMAETTELTDQNTASVKKNADANNASAKALKTVADTQSQVIDQFKKPITPQVDFSQINQIGTKLATLKKTFSTNAGNLKVFLDTSELAALDQKVASAKGEFDQITQIVDTLSKKLQQLEPGTAEFNDLAAAVGAGNQVLKEYNNLYTKAIESTSAGEPVFKSIRTRLKEYRNELTALEDAGLDETQQFKDTQLAAAKLSDQYNDMQQRIRVLASDTRVANFGAAAIQAAGAGFQVAAGAMELFGASSEDAQKSQARLLAIMSLVQGAQQLNTLLLKDNTLAVEASNAANVILSKTELFLADTFGISTVAAEGFSAALLATGIGTLIILIGAAVVALNSFEVANIRAAGAMQRLTDSIASQRAFLQDDLASIDQVGKIRALKLQQINAEQSVIYKSGQDDLERQKKLYATRNDAIDQTVLDEQKKKDGESNSAFEKRIADETKKGGLFEDLRKEQLENGFKIIELGRTQDIAAETEALRVINKRIEDNKLYRKETNDIFKEGLNDRGKELADQQLNYQEQYRDQVRAHQDTTKLTQSYQAERRTLLAKYAKEDYDANRQIAIELETLQTDLATKRIDNIQDEFKQRDAAIKNDARKERETLSNNLVEFQNKLSDDLKDGIITPQQYQEQLGQLNKLYDGLFNEIDKKILIDTAKLNADIFQNLIAEIERSLKFSLTDVSAATTREIQTISLAYLKGSTSYERYQKQLTKISNQETKTRLQDTQKSVAAELAKVVDRLSQSGLSPEDRKNLENQKDELINRLSDTDRQLATNDAENKKKQIDADQAALDARLQAYEGFAKSIVSLIDQIDAAEQSRLDRAISYQQKRVDYAQQIAEEGNAEYLEMEQKRLDELERQKEQSAQRTLAINNALVLSEALVAVISAIAKAAAEGSFVNILAAAGAVIGAVGAGYAFVSSLDNPVPNFWEGTPFVEGTGGRDNVPAMVSRGERITDVATNAEYWDTLNAIHNKDIPAEALNSFVNKYPHMDIPSLNVSRLGNSMDIMIATGIGDTNQKLDRLIELNENFEPVKVDTKMDENGFSQAIYKRQRRDKLRKRA